jgi:small subunit ribosomal protein S1
VLNVNKEKQEISLGLKQTETNPWTVASQKYPVGTIVTTTVRSVTNFGAFVEIEPGIDGMIHISDLSWTRKFTHPSEALQKGERIKCIVLDVNEEKRRISLGIKQMTEDPWIRAIPEKYIPGHIIKGKVAKLTNFGAFVELEQDLEGLLHISELADHKIDKPQDIVDVNQEVEVKILKVDSESRKIGLSLRRVQWAADEQTDEKAEKEPIRRKHPTAVENVLSDHDVARITGSKEEAGPGDAAAGSDAVEEKAVKEADAGHQSKDQEQAAEPVEESKEEAAAAESGHEGIDEHSEQAAEAPDEEAQAEADSEKSEDKAEEQEDKG